MQSIGNIIREEILLVRGKTSEKLIGIVHEHLNVLFHESHYLVVLDGLSEREMRRISYKVAEGSWKRLSCGLPINEENLHQIMNSNGNGQEKVYQLLNCWRTETNVPRTDLLKQLSQYIDPNRKDVIKFLKEMSGVPTKDRKSIKTKFRKLKLTVRR